MTVDPKPRPRRRRKPRAKPLTQLWRRAAESFATIRGIVTEPRTAPSRAREAFVTLWRVRGGGFYGLG